MQSYAETWLQNKYTLSDALWHYNEKLCRCSFSWLPFPEISLCISGSEASKVEPHHFNVRLHVSHYTDPFVFCRLQFLYPLLSSALLYSPSHPELCECVWQTQGCSGSYSDPEQSADSLFTVFSFFFLTPCTSRLASGCLSILSPSPLLRNISISLP